MNWIPCSERLPEKNGRYLVVKDILLNGTLLEIDILDFENRRRINKKRSGFCFYDANMDRVDLGYGDNKYVTHWMPLPEMPKKKAAAIKRMTEYYDKIIAGISGDMTNKGKHL